MPRSYFGLEFAAQTLVNDVLTVTVPTVRPRGARAAQAPVVRTNPGPTTYARQGCTMTSCSQDSDCGPGERVCERRAVHLVLLARASDPDTSRTIEARAALMANVRPPPPKVCLSRAAWCPSGVHGSVASGVWVRGVDTIGSPRPDWLAQETGDGASPCRTRSPARPRSPALTSRQPVGRIAPREYGHDDHRLGRSRHSR